MATTLRADEKTFQLLSEISTDFQTKSDNKTLIRLIHDYKPTKQRVKELEAKVRQLEQFKEKTSMLLQAEKAVQTRKNELLEMI